MKKSLAFFAVILFPIVLSAQSWQKGSLEDALAAAKAAGKPLLIDFFAETG
jgi:hypothetical protein